jgi:hypothetical protein
VTQVVECISTRPCIQSPVLTKGENISWAPVAHTCNPSYSGGRDQEDRGSKPAQANSSGDPISKKIFHKKKGLVQWLKVKALSSSPSSAKKRRVEDITI